MGLLLFEQPHNCLFNMKYICLKTTNPYYNLAVEEYVFRHAEDDVFMLWQNEPSVICGKNQNVYAEVDLAYAKERGIHICRRITGGGAVYHDLGNINYTFISTHGDARALDFEYFSRPIRNAITKMGVCCRMSERNDIECDGGKFSGNAQHAEGGRILHHGTLLFNTDFDVMEEVLRVDKEKLAYRAVKSLRSRVVNLLSLLPQKISLSAFLGEIERDVCTELLAEAVAAPSNEEIDAICKRNESAEWILSDKRYLTSYTVRRKKKYPFGLVALDMELERSVIRRIRILGDFFGTLPVETLEQTLLGKDVREPLAIDPSPYIHGMSAEELSSLLSDGQ